MREKEHVYKKMVRDRRKDWGEQERTANRIYGGDKKEKGGGEFTVDQHVELRQTLSWRFPTEKN